MKLKLLCFSVLLMLLGSAGFATRLPNKMVMLPFKNVALFSRTHDGLVFTYDMYGVPKRNVVCEMEHVYKGWLEFPRDGGRDETPTYGGEQKVVLTNNERERRDHRLDILRADRAGTVNIRGIKLGRRSIAVVSCNYEPSEIG